MISDLSATVASAFRAFARRAGGGLRALAHRLVKQRRLHAVGAATVAFAFFVVLSIAPPAPPSDAQELQAYLDEHGQTLTVATDATPTDPAVDDRGEYGATPGIPTLVKEGTNYAWAKMVLLFADLPMTDDNVTVFTRWMRQENGADDWWNRNNPLNNGWGSGGGGGTGTYPNLVVAAQNAAEAMRTLPGYQGFVAAFEKSAATEKIESAIWNSNWASGHYAYGGHW
ncbi:MAG: hypothetical protein ABI632_09990, partial [Pseudolysinimonas sp.]